MARFYGIVGYVIHRETRPGVWTDEVEEHYYYGDTKKLYMKWDGTQRINDDITPRNQIRIVANEYAFSNAGSIRYVKWMGTYWKVTDFEVERPRITLTLGGVYNGKKAATP